MLSVSTAPHRRGCRHVNRLRRKGSAPLSEVAAHEAPRAVPPAARNTLPARWGIHIQALLAVTEIINKIIRGQANRNTL